MTQDKFEYLPGDLVFCSWDQTKSGDQTKQCFGIITAVFNTHGLCQSCDFFDFVKNTSRQVFPLEKLASTKGLYSVFKVYREGQEVFDLHE